MEMERMVRSALCALVLGLCPALGVAQQRAQAGELRTAQSACIFDHTNLWTAPGTCRPHARAYPATMHSSVRRAIYDSALTFGVPFPVLLKIGKCESSLNPRASNGTHFGLFQFARDTFKRAIVLMKTDTGISARSVWSPLDSSYAAGYLFATGHSPAWTCETAQTPATG